MVMAARADAAPFRALAQQTAQTATQPAVQLPTRRLHIAHTEELEPAAQYRRQIRADRLQTARACAPRSRAQDSPQFVHALLAGPAFLPLIVPAQIVKTLVEMNDPGLFRAELQSQPVQYLTNSF